jgi:hypothetical protein
MPAPMGKHFGLIASLCFVIVALTAAAVVFHAESYLLPALVAVGFWTVVTQLTL